MGDRDIDYDATEEMFGPESWNPQSWNGKPEAQAVHYSSSESLKKTIETLHLLPPLVDPTIIENARTCLADVAHGRAFIIQGGDCAEDFSDIQFGLIADKVKLLSAQADVLGAGLGLPIVRIGRIAGQYAKPRSNPFETLPDGRKIHAFRGCNVNTSELDGRSPDPSKLLSGYFHAAATLNTISHIDESHQRAATATLPKASQLFTSHEALSLPFEAALTRGKYDTSATMIWIGERTRQLDGAHVELLRGLRNPVGVKIGPMANPSDLVTLLNALSRDGAEPGKLTLITRMGAGKVENVLPALIRAVNESGHKPVWLCDPW
jgi:3-deoxy-7-phosphoheptulonate synthase